MKADSRLGDAVVADHRSAFQIKQIGDVVATNLINELHDGNQETLPGRKNILASARIDSKLVMAIGQKTGTSLVPVAVVSIQIQADVNFDKAVLISHASPGWT